MFTGIIEETGIVKSIIKDQSNLKIHVCASFLNELKINQSIAHNGICLTVIDIKKDYYVVEAIEETLIRTNLGMLKTGEKINLERCLSPSDRLDGHIVQGHIDQIAVCKEICDNDGSWLFTFSHSYTKENITVKKGSICINGVSLTIVQSERDWFSVAIIQHTYMNTNFKSIKQGDHVNIEFDIIGKYAAALIHSR